MVRPSLLCDAGGAHCVLYPFHTIACVVCPRCVLTIACDQCDSSADNQCTVSVQNVKCCRLW